MRIRQISLIVAALVVALLALASALTVLAGSTDSPAVPGSTSSYTLEDIYDRLNEGTAGSQSTFVEPASGPPTGTMHTLNDIMGKAPVADDSDGATTAQVLSSKTYWGLRTTEWATQTGTMTDNGAVTIVPTTTNQTIAVGYHNGSGYVEGDADLVASNIVSDVVIFGITGTAATATYPASVPKTGQTTSDYTRDDGDLQKGVAWPNPRFTDNSDGTVTDNLTGLIWLKDASCGSLAGTDTWGRGNWFTANSAANALADGTCGLSDGSSAGDWRLPNVRELQSLIHYGVYSPAVPDTAGTAKWSAGDPFTEIQYSSNEGPYWTSTADGYLTVTYAWVVYVYYGTAGREAQSTNTLWVWPVRDGQ